MEKELTVKQWIEKYENGEFDSKDRETQCKAGWYDWFCNDKALQRRLKSMAPKVIWFANQDIMDLDKVYVFFKNNCPMVGELYDWFSFCDIKTGDVIFNITPKTGHRHKSDFKCELWGMDDSKENGFGEIHRAKNWNEMKKWITENKEYLKGLYQKAMIKLNDKYKYQLKLQKEKENKIKDFKDNLEMYMRTTPDIHNIIVKFLIDIDSIYTVNIVLGKKGLKYILIYHLDMDDYDDYIDDSDYYKISINISAENVFEFVKSKLPEFMVHNPSLFKEIYENIVYELGETYVLKFIDMVMSRRNSENFKRKITL